MSKIGFLATEFGFGPVSKVVAVAKSVQEIEPSVRLSLLGSGNVLRFAQLSDAFNQCIEFDVDRSKEDARRATEGCDAIVDCLQFDCLKYLSPDGPPVYFLDSLCWLWPSVPSKVDLCRRYFLPLFLLYFKTQILN